MSCFLRPITIIAIAIIKTNNVAETAMNAILTVLNVSFKELIRSFELFSSEVKLLTSCSVFSSLSDKNVK